MLRSGFRGTLRFLTRSINDSNSLSELSDSNPALGRRGMAGVLFSVLFSQLLSLLPVRKSGLPVAIDSF